MLELRTADGVTLESRWDTPADATSRNVVFCHPHPLHGGTMTAPLMEYVTRNLVAAGFAVLRFNFRGIGRSGGSWGGGIEELHDVAAAMQHAAEGADELAVIGWSFGAAAALRWQARDRDGSRYVGIAPPVSGAGGRLLPGASDLPPATRTIIIGGRDQLISVDEARAYAEAIAARFEVLPTSDHFFMGRATQLSSLVLASLGR